MKSFSDNFVNTSHYDTDGPTESENFSSESSDPLLELGDEPTESRCFRIESIVFAEPLKNISDEETTSKDQTNYCDKEEITFIDNIIVQKGADRKYKKYHINIEEASDLTCPQNNCTRTFLSTKLLKAHIRKVHCADRSKFICEQCGAGFSALYLLVRHSAVHSDNSVPCVVCSKLLSQRTSLSSHVRCHSGARPHSCGVCRKSFSRASALAAHVKFVHREGPLTCDKCDARFSSRKQWSQHMATHRRNKPNEADTS